MVVADHTGGVDDLKWVEMVVCEVELWDDDDGSIRGDIKQVALHLILIHLLFLVTFVIVSIVVDPRIKIISRSVNLKKPLHALTQQHIMCSTPMLLHHQIRLKAIPVTTRAWQFLTI